MAQPPPQPPTAASPQGGPPPPALHGWSRVPTSAGSWWARPASDRLPGALARLIEGSPVEICELPQVTGTLVWRDRAGQIVDRHYRLRWFDGQTQTVGRSAMVRDESWPAAGDIPSDQKTRDVIAAAIRRQARPLPDLEAVPVCPGGTLILPPDSHHAATPEPLETVGRDSWRASAALLERNPKVALVAGAATIGPWLEHLGRPAFVLHLVGDSSEGKTTALRVAGAVLGDPDLTVTTWNTTVVGLGRRLGALGVLPAVVDELAGGALTPAGLEALVYRVSDGAERETATRTGNGTLTSPRWHSVLISSGNRGLSNVTASPGLPVRAVDLPTPIVATADDAHELARLADAGAGWPLRWALDEPRPADYLVRYLADADQALNTRQGGIVGRVARHLAACVAGAHYLGWLISGPKLAGQLGGAALTAAADHLAELADSLGETGRLADQLLAAILEAGAARPYAYPTRDNQPHAVRELEGIRDPDTLHIFTGALARIAAAAGIVDPLPALRELRRRGVLYSDTGKLCARIRLAGSIVRTYAIRLNLPDEGGARALPRAPGGSRGARPQLSDQPLCDAARPARPARPCFALGHVIDLEKEHVSLDASRFSEAAAATAALAETYEKPTLGAHRARLDYDRRLTALGPRLAALPDSVRIPIEARLDISPPEAIGALEAAVRAAEADSIASPARNPQRPPQRPRPPLREPPALETRQQMFAKACIRAGLDEPGEGQAAAALARLEAATALSFERPTFPAAGLQWIQALPARRPSARQPVDLPAGLVASFTVTDPARADAGTWVVQLDRNASYANAAQSLELGSGPMAVIREPRIADLKAPGWVTVTAVDRWPLPFGRLEPGAKLWTPLAALLLEVDPAAQLADAVIWAEHHRYLGTFARRLLKARATLARAEHPADHLALAAIKRIYSGTLGGIIRSRRNNRTTYYRPEWGALIEANATAGMWRHLLRLDPGPAAVMHTDAAYFTTDSPDPPAGLTISAQPGKWKTERVAPLTAEIRRAIAHGHAGRISKLIESQQ